MIMPEKERPVADEYQVNLVLVEGRGTIVYHTGGTV